MGWECYRWDKTYLKKLEFYTVELPNHHQHLVWRPKVKDPNFACAAKGHASWLLFLNSSFTRGLIAYSVSICACAFGIICNHTGRNDGDLRLNLLQGREEIFNMWLKLKSAWHLAILAGIRAKLVCCVSLHNPISSPAYTLDQAITRCLIEWQFSLSFPFVVYRQDLLSMTYSQDCIGRGCHAYRLNPSPFGKGRAASHGWLDTLRGQQKQCP